MGSISGQQRMTQSRSTDDGVVDVAVIGAGLAGLTCARQLQHSGLTVEVFDKSRGLGGRLATRRIQSAWMDHGVRYWQAQGEQSQSLLRILLNHDILQPWRGSIGKWEQSGPVMSLNQDADQSDGIYVSPVGLTAIAKLIAQDLTIHRNRRATAIAPTSLGQSSSGQWQIQFASSSDAENLACAKAVVLAVPAPQALPLLAPLVKDGLSPDVPQHIQSVAFDPCISVMAGYASAQVTEDAQLLRQWQALQLMDHPMLSWISLEQSKAHQSEQPLLLLQSTATFAKRYLDADDLQSAGAELLAALAELDRPEWANPDWMQAHRWRYAFTRQPLGKACLAVSVPLPLICCGDWCLGNSIEDALQSGVTAATQLATMI
ncbi:MAG: NAD(P)/FAD-dependent oxidoreductase [Thainema sp.]